MAGLIEFIAPDFNAPLTDLVDYMETEGEREARIRPG